MKKTSLIILLIFGVNFSYSQEEMKTLFKKDTTAKPKSMNSYGGYGAPFVGATTLNGGSAIIVGGKGGVIKNHRFVFGGVGSAIIGTTSFSDSIKKYNSNVDSTSGKKMLAMGYGGVFVEYIINYGSPVHISIPVNIEAGGVLAGTSSDNMPIKSSAVFVLEPGINFEFNVCKFFVPSFNVGYRYVSGDYSSKLSGLYGTLMFKFGKF